MPLPIPYCFAPGVMIHAHDDRYGWAENAHGVTLGIKGIHDCLGLSLYAALIAPGRSGPAILRETVEVPSAVLEDTPVKQLWKYTEPMLEDCRSFAYGHIPTDATKF